MNPHAETSLGPDNAAAVAAIAAITGQSVASAEEMFTALAGAAPERAAPSGDEVASAVNRLCTRIGLAPALSQSDREHHLSAMTAIVRRGGELSHAELRAWDQILRSVPEKIPTLEQAPVELAPMPAHQQEMWATLLDFEESDPPPRVLVGGQMTALHLAENGITAHRATDDGDMVVGVWTRRDALRSTTVYLVDSGFTESRTGDGYGYRFVRGATTIDVMVPEGLERQSRYPTTSLGRPGLAAAGSNQALTRAERLPISLDGRTGFVRRPTVLGGLVSKARAWIVDNRNPERHAQDLIALSEVALRDPRSVISSARPDDRRAIRAALTRLPEGHRLLRAADDPTAVRALLVRLAGAHSGSLRAAR